MSRVFLYDLEVDPPPDCTKGESPGTPRGRLSLGHDHPPAPPCYLYLVLRYLLRLRILRGLYSPVSKSFKTSDHERPCK